MKYLLAGITVFFSSITFAQDLNFSEYRKFLMNGTKTPGQKMAIQMTCTTAAGKTYRIGETGYDTCLTAIKTQQEAKSLSSSNDGAQAGDTSGAATTIHFGN